MLTLGEFLSSKGEKLAQTIWSLHRYVGGYLSSSPTIAQFKLGYCWSHSLGHIILVLGLEKYTSFHEMGPCWPCSVSNVM
jgi:hypothetical protein